MFNDRQLTNFKHYIDTTPKALWGMPPRDPQGAYDAAGGRAGHGFGGRKGIPSYAFDRGGELDAIGQKANVHEALKFLACKLSPEDWTDLRMILREGREEDDDGATDDPPAFKDIPRTGGAMDARPRPITAQSARDYADRFPGAARIGRA